MKKEVEKAEAPPAWYGAIATLPFRLILTANYDTLLERAFDDESVDYRRAFDTHDLERRRRDERRIIKPYGCITEPSSLVITEEDRCAFLDRWPRMLDALGLALPGRSPLFIGCDLTDPDFRQLYRAIAPRIQGAGRSAYLVQEEVPDSLRRYWANEGLTVVDEDVEELLESATALMEAREAKIAAQELAYDPLPLELEAASWSETGPVRGVNQDRVQVCRPGESERGHRGDLFIVADGMGGHNAGEVASQLAIDVIVNEYYAIDADPEDIPQVLTRAVERANEAICHQADENPSLRGMGTTVTAAAVRGGDLYVANVGDSRAYVVSQGMIEQVSLDHSFVAEEIRAGRMGPEQAKDHPQRSLLTRVLGPQPRVDVDVFHRRLGKGDVLVLCSDGLTEYVDDEEIKEEVSTNPAGSAVRRLAKFANDREGSDNISVIVVKVS